MNKDRHKTSCMLMMRRQAFARSRMKKSVVLKGIHLATSIVILLKLLTLVSSQEENVVEGADKSKLSVQEDANESNDRAQAKSVAHVSQAQIEKEAFVVELLKTLHEQYGSPTSQQQAAADVMQERRSPSYQTHAQARMMPQLLEAIGAEGDMRRLIDWIKGSFDPSLIPEVTTQFVVSKLGSVNCPALLRPDKEESLIPRFLLFNEHHVDVPFELPIKPTADDCITNAKFDPFRKTIVIIHGYLGGYTLIDGLTNIKNRILDSNRFANEQAIGAFLRASNSANSSYVFTEDLSSKIRSQLYNVIIVDWFNGANPRPRANYIRAAVNAQVVGKLIARFLSALIVQCKTPAEQLQIIAHSLGCHVSGFTGKAMNAAGHRLGKITHLDPVGLCFGRLFSQRRYRLAPNDALETQAVHVSLNVFDNPLDGAHSNFLVNGGRDQPGCGNQNEVSNSTISSVSLLWDPAARFAPCSHLRALALFEDDHSSRPDQCQFVGYRCANYDRFLAGKCGFCDSTNSQCRLMGLTPVSLKFRTMTLDNYHYDAEPLVEPLSKHFATFTWRDLHGIGSEQKMTFVNSSANANNSTNTLMSAKNSSIASSQSNTTTRRPARSLKLQLQSSQAPTLSGSTIMYGQPAYFVGGNHLSRRSERRLVVEQRERISNAIEKLRSDTRLAWTSLRQTEPPPGHAENDESVDDEKLELTKDVDNNQFGPDDVSDGFDEMPSSASSSTTNTTNETQSTTQTSTTLTTNKPAVDAAAAAQTPSELLQRQHEDLLDQTPIGGQPIPADSLNGPLFFMGTGSTSPFCVNYYQVRVLIAESRLLRVMSQNGLASNRLKAQYNLASGSILRAGLSFPQASVQSGGRDMLHLTIKLTDSLGHFFKGFSILESAGSLARVMNDFIAPPSLALASSQQASAALNEPMLEVTMLLNSTRAQPTKVAETIISYYFHPIVLADRVEINYMSNISPDIRAKYSSVLCPVAINDRHQLVKYIECHKVSRRRRRRRRRK